MEDAKRRLADTLKSANNILVSLSRDPSVDQLASLIGLTLYLTKFKKHAVAVFSGQVPSTLEFLKPEETLEKNTDSLRDFIISLDKNKADKLRYKIENNVVKIFITPYKTSISQSDLEFTQGDFNVDVVVALGVSKQDELDEAITAYGQIMHDATITSISTSNNPGLGSINWHDPNSSSLGEMVTELTQMLDPKLIDTQIATALLTGVVSETDRFSNDKTSAQTMNISSVLMGAGANQQLVANKLEAPEPEPKATNQDTKDEIPEEANPNGEIEIEHTPSDKSATDEPKEIEPDIPKADKQPSDSPPKDELSSLSPGAKLVTEPPTLGGTLTANAQVNDDIEPSTDPLSLPKTDPPALLDRKSPVGDTSPPAEPPQDNLKPAPSMPPPPAPTPVFTPPPPTWTPPLPPTSTTSPPTEPPVAVSDSADNESLAELEKTVKDKEAAGSQSLDNARDEVNKALNDPDVMNSELPKPVEALNAQPLGGPLHDDRSQPPVPPSSNQPPPVPPPFPLKP